MALPFEELEAITDDYFMLDNGKAIDIYFYTSFLLNYLLKQQKGIWERPSGGEKIRIPLEYDGQEAEFYSRGETISSDDRESINAAYFLWKHAYGNATIYRIDQLKNAGEYAEVQLVQQRVSGAQKSLTALLAGSLYDLPSGDTKRLTGLRACCNETSSLAYGGIAEDDLVAVDGTKPWEGKMDSTTESISLGVIRNMASAAKIRDGKGGKPDLVTLPETLWNVIADLLQVQQRFTQQNSESVKAGFTGLWFEGKDIFADDYCPAGHAFALNSNHIGFAVHQDGLFMRSPWKIIPDSPEDKTMKIYFDGNLVVNNRKGHQGHSNLS
jgi:hypothetical protein